MPSQFITTEPLGKLGEAGEQRVWGAVREAFADRPCIGYWRYPIFSGGRKEPDILIADADLGLVVIEVKSVTINQIVQITGHRWEYQNFYMAFGNPYQQAEHQLWALLEYSDREPSLRRQVPARAMVALPSITQQQWQARGWEQLPTSPPLLFQQDLESSALIDLIAQTPPVVSGKPLTTQQWNLLLSVLAGTPLYCQGTRRVLTPSQSRGSILQQVRSHISQLDWQQEKIAKEIPPGPQRIRGIAGSGKTVLLCQKAAQMHLKHPDWTIAVVFFSRSLYRPITEQIDRWLRYFSHNQQGYRSSNRRLRILHAWGSRKQPGLYSTLCRATGVERLTVKDTQSRQPSEALAEACINLLQATAIPGLFDALLIDEGQDLIVDRLKFESKQPFYWLAYQALRPADPMHPDQRRLIWAYDEAQSLESLSVPTAREIFGEELAHLVTGNYRGGISKSEVMHRCYRTPGPILTAAHGIGMGLLRSPGMLTGMTRAEEWQAIGYEVQGQFTSGQPITLQRPPQNSPHPLPHLWQGDLIEFQAYSTRQQELTALAQDIIHNLRYDGLRPSQEILVLVVGHFFEAAKLETHLAQFLMQQGIDIFIPGTGDCNLIQPGDRANPNQFWWEGAVTVSRLGRAKGHEADMVYVVGLDHVAQAESSITLRNQVLVALTRARGWAKLSGIGAYRFYEEIDRVLQSGDTFSFTFRRPPQRELSVTDVGELLKRYAQGSRNFRHADLRNAQLVGVNLNGANLIGANLREANLSEAQLAEAKLISADLNGANLTRANLRKAKLIGANLANTQLNGADLTGAILDTEEP